MLFSLQVSNSHVSPDQAEKLAKLGFKLIKFDEESSLVDENPFIEVNIPDDLMSLVKDFGGIIITTDSIEIYNGWRE